MKSYEWDSRNQRLLEVDDPCYLEDESDHLRSIHVAGYFQEISSGEGLDSGGSIDVYRNNQPDQAHPEYYIDVWGGNTNFGTFIARDFPALVETLRYLHPMLQLLELDQRSTGRLVDQLDKKL